VTLVLHCGTPSKFHCCQRLDFFFVIIYVFATLRRIDIHPINYLFLGGAFFAFHLLFAYLVDHTQVIPAFVAASAVSLILVVTYLRLVVSNRFALREAALAQLLYLVGFSVAHFWEGFTGLTVTVLAIATLFAVMQLTGRVNWTELLAGRKETATLASGAQTRG
jgi:inner membrane protein involved in colicin E2 resistance